MPGKIMNVLQPAVAAALAVLLLQACPAPSVPTVSPPQPTITKETIKDSAGNPIGTITVKQDTTGKPISRILTVSPSLTAVPASAFANRGITAVTIPSKITSIGNRAFAGNRLTELTLPSSVTSVGAEAFKGNPGLKFVIISQGLLNKTSADTFPASAVFTDHGSKVITRWVSTETTDADGSKITLVKDNNGRGRVISKTLELSSTVTAVPASKFANKELTAIRIPPETTSIGNQAFNAASTTITAKSLEIPKSLTAIPNGSGTTGTYSAIGLTSLSFVLPSSLTSIGQNAFRDNGLTAVTIPNTVTRIGESAFNNNRIASIRIPDSVTNIERMAFYDNTVLASVTIGNSVTTIGQRAFERNQISSVTISASVRTIGLSAFRDNRLTSVNITASVRTIGSSAFRDNRLTSVTIPNTVTSIGQRAFAGNTGLTAVTISQALKNRTPANAFPSGVTFTYH